MTSFLASICFVFLAFGETTDAQPFTLSGTTDKPSYLKSEIVKVSTSYLSATDVSGISLGVQILDSAGQSRVKTFTAKNLSAGVAFTNEFDFVPSGAARLGTYKLVVSVYKNSPWTLLAAGTSSYDLTAPTAKLLFSDEFNTLSLASATNPTGFWRPNSAWQNISSGGFKDFAGRNWNINPNHPDFAAYTPFTVANGILTIRSYRTPAALIPSIQTQMAQQGIGGTVPEWCGGTIVQNPAVMKFKYGYFVTRMRLPVQGKGMFPAFWLLATDGNRDPLGKGAAEIDMLEIMGRPNYWSTNLHLKDSNKIGPSYHLGSLAEDVSGWHTYAIDWQPTYLRIYRDNVLKYEVTGSTATWYNTTLGLRFNYAMDAGFFDGLGLHSDASTPDNLQLQIDYIRVYDRKP